MISGARDGRARCDGAPLADTGLVGLRCSVLRRRSIGLLERLGLTFGKKAPYDVIMVVIRICSLSKKNKFYRGLTSIWSSLETASRSWISSEAYPVPSACETVKNNTDAYMLLKLVRRPNACESCAARRFREDALSHSIAF